MSARTTNQQGCLSGVILCILCNNDSAHRCGCQVTYNTIAMQSRKVKLHEIGNCWRPLKKNVFYTKEGYTCLLYMYGVSVLRYLVWILSLWDNISKMDFVMESITKLSSKKVTSKHRLVVLLHCTSRTISRYCTNYPPLTVNGP